jgi:alpha-mannosidase
MPFAGKLTPAEAIRLGKSFNRPLRLISTNVHAGKLPQLASAITPKGDNAILSDLKISEDGAALVLHLTNPSDSAQAATLTLNPTLLGRFAKVEEVDLMERPLPRTTATLRGNTLTAKVPANALLSLRLQKA